MTLGSGLSTTTGERSTRAKRCAMFCSILQTASGSLPGLASGMVPRANDGEKTSWINRPHGSGCSGCAAAESAPPSRAAPAAPSPDLGRLDAAGRRLIELYTPLCRDCPERFVVAHLGQSLDGRIATVDGSSRWVTGPEDVAHNHRMRALFDAVVVGAGTVRDDPQLTVRLVPGRNPTRVVLDPRRRLNSHYRIFTDGAARTLVLCADELVNGYERLGQAEVIGVGRTAADPTPCSTFWPGAASGACSSKAAVSPCRDFSPPAACIGCRSRSRR